MSLDLKKVINPFRVPFPGKNENNPDFYFENETCSEYFLSFEQVTTYKQ